MIRKNRGYTFAVLAALAACSLPAASQTVSQAEMEQLLSKPTKISYLGANGGLGRVEYAPDKRMWISASTPRPFNDSGTYRLDNGKFCATWKTIRDGKEICFTWKKRDDGKYDNLDEGGVVTSTFEILK